jgi:hypothetical protein
MFAPITILAGGVTGSLLYILATAVYNLYLHPLNNIPGPRLWIVFPILRHVSGMRGLFDIHMREFHDYYGDIVR